MANRINDNTLEYDEIMFDEKIYVKTNEICMGHTMTRLIVFQVND
jgi:hypothetical protein